MKICPKCGIEHEMNGRFCSSSCANSRVFTDEVNKKRAESSRLYHINNPVIKTRKCKKCYERFEIVKRESICLKCKYDTSHEHAKILDKRTSIERTIDLIESGEVKTHTEVSIRRHMKRFLLHTTGNVCSICGTTDWFGKPVPLVCDHIDGDSTNSDKSNFRLVCCNCDALLDTFKSKNRGNGRQYDREYRNRKANPMVGDGDSLEMS